jgi:uncharacterized membrane protein
MKVKLLVGALIVLVIMNLAALGTFWFMRDHRPAPPFGERPGREWRMHRGAGHNLSREERQLVFRAMRGIPQEVRPLIEETGVLEDDLIASMKKDPVPRAHIDSLHQQISAKRLEIARRATDRMIAMSDSLSPAERELMIDAMVRFRRGGFGGPAGGPPPWRRGD